MPRILRSSVFFVFLAALLMAGFTATSATAEEPSKPEFWDSAAATKLAIELSDTFERGLEASKTAPPQDTAFQQRQREAAQGALRRAREASANFAEQMQAGADKFESERLFQGVVSTVAEMRETAGDAEPTDEGKRILKRVDEIFRELRALYALPEAQPKAAHGAH